MQEKIAKSLLPHAIALSNNQYGRFFYKRLNLPLYESRPKEWREVQLKVVHHFYGPKTAVGEAAVRANRTETAAVATSTVDDAKVEQAASPVAGEDGEVKPVKKEKKEKKSKKRARDSEDEIDDLFAEVISDKKKKKKKKSKQA